MSAVRIERGQLCILYVVLPTKPITENQYRLSFAQYLNNLNLLSTAWITVLNICNRWPMAPPDKSLKILCCQRYSELYRFSFSVVQIHAYSANRNAEIKLRCGRAAIRRQRKLTPLGLLRTRDLTYLNYIQLPTKFQYTSLWLDTKPHAHLHFQPM
jgi:hypothetical protein